MWRGGCLVYGVLDGTLSFGPERVPSDFGTLELSFYRVTHRLYALQSTSNYKSKPLAGCTPQQRDNNYEPLKKY